MELIHSNEFYEITTLLVLAGLLGLIGLWLKQPIIVSFMAVGVLVGESALNIVKNQTHVDILSELGISLLLFLVGLKLDLNLIRKLGTVAVATGLGQIFFTSFLGFFIGIALGIDSTTALYIAIALTFSSTIIIVKLLSDKKESESLHGRIAVGFLIVQDLFVVISMMILSAFGISSENQQGLSLEVIALKVIAYCLGVLGFIILFIKFLANSLINYIVRAPELLVVFAIGWAALFASLGDYIGFSKELGGLLAGISLASTPLRDSIISRLSGLRDFLLLFFFISLGSKLDLSLLGNQVVSSIIFSIFVLIGNPLIVMIIMGLMGYRKRTGFMAGLTVAQISEFSLIFIAMGVSLGHVDSSALGLVTLVGLITISLSVYMITYSNYLYRIVEPFIGVFERKTNFREQEETKLIDKNQPVDFILLGIGRFGSALLEQGSIGPSKSLLIDFNPDVVKKWRSRGYNAIYGDAADQEFLRSLPVKTAKWIIASMPNYGSNLLDQDPRFILVDFLKREGYQGKIGLTSQNPDEVEKLIDYGADKVFLPYQETAYNAAIFLQEELSNQNHKKS